MAKKREDALSMEEILRAGLPELGLSADEAAIAKLRRYAALLEEANRVMNLTAIRGEEDVARLHFLDCAAVLRYVPLAGKRVLDVGSGAGFPGMVLKILAPAAEVTLLDSLQKRVGFQRRTAEALELTGIECLAGRAEEMPELRESFDVVTSRAVARLNILSELCLPMVRPGGVFAAMKGRSPEEELREAERCLRTLGGGEPRVEKYTVPGTDAVHTLVIIPKEKPTPPGYPRRFAAIKKQPL